MYEYNPNRHNQHHNHPRYDMREIYTISNPMMFQHSHTDHMGPKHPRGPPQTMPLNDCPSSPSERNSMVMMDRKEPPVDVCGRLRLKYVFNALVVVIVTGIEAGVEFGYIPHKIQSFRCKDPKLSYKFQGDTIRPSVLGVVTATLPLITFLVVEYMCNKGNWKRIGFLMWRWIRIFFIGNFIINLFITQVLKTTFGEPRPHFFDTCSPNVTGCLEGDIIDSYTCTNTQYSFMLIRDTSRSFPSGHASISVFTSIFCAAYIYYRMKSSTIDCGSLLKPFVIALVLTWGPACGLSRIADHRHHWWDVLAGSILGATSAFFTIYTFAKKFYVKEKQRPCSSSTNLVDDVLV